MAGRLELETCVEVDGGPNLGLEKQAAAAVGHRLVRLEPHEAYPTGQSAVKTFCA